MWIKWLKWRKEYNIDSINVDDIESELISGKAYWHKYDKEGNPCCVVTIKKHIPSETNFLKTMKFFVYIMEIGIKMAEKSGT